MTPHGHIKEAALTALRLRLKAAGFSPVPAKGKNPSLDNWQNQFNISEDEIAGWSRQRPDLTNTGIITRDTPSLDIDVLNSNAVAAAVALVRQRFEGRGRVLLRTGLAPKVLIPFRTAEPFEKISIAFELATKGAKSEKLEFLGNGQQFIAAGKHPDTRQAYTWAGGEPGDVTRQELPEITQAEAQALIEDVANLLVREHAYQRARGRPKDAGDYWDEAGGGNAVDDWAYLIDNIHAGRDLHDSLRSLAAKLIRSGMAAGAAVNFLRGQMDLSTTPHDERWLERRSDIPRLVETAEERFASPDSPKTVPPAEPRSLADVHEVFRRWLGADYDIATLDATLAVAAAERMQGDPPWLLIISGPGNAKTETVQSTSRLGAHVVSTITSDAALLSATPQRQRAKNATGGLLRKIGDRGILAIKDVTSILSADRNVRSQILAALREVHDGSWTRNVGTDGGKTLTWTGRIVLIGACTTAWDQAHSVVSTMGDRFVVIRSDSRLGRVSGGRQAMRNTGDEVRMREEMAEAVAGVINGIDPANIYALTEDDENIIVEAANVVTLARTGVEIDYRGDVIDAHAPEMPTRFAKQLTQIMRGSIAIGMTRDDALQLVLRCARDSMPQIRLAVLHDIANHPDSRVIDVRRRLQKPRATTDRTLQALHILGLLTVEEEEAERAGKSVQIRKYSLAVEINLTALGDGIGSEIPF